MEDNKKTKSQLLAEIKALRQQAAHLPQEPFHAIVDHDPDIIARFDRQLRHLYINRQIELATGLPAHSFIGKTNREMGMPGHLVEKWEGTLHQVFETGQPATIEFVFPSPDGEKCFESRVIPERNGSADVKSVLVICRDITSVKLAEEIRFQARLLNTVEQAVIATKTDGAIIFWNRTAEVLYGWRAAEVFGKNIMEITVPQVSQSQGEEIMAKLRQGESWSGEFVVQRKDGSVFPAAVSDSPIFDDHKNLIGVVGISKDISENKKSEEALKLAEAKYRTLVEHSLQGISIFQNRRLVFANQALANILGYSIPALLALTEEEVLGIVHAEDLGNVQQRLAALLAGEKITPRNTIRLVRNDGAIRWVEVSSTATEYGDRPAVQTFVLDITERHLAEQALKYSERKFREVFENSPDAIFVHDRQGNLLDVNQAACRLHKMEYAELIQKNVRDLVPPDQSQNAYEYVQRLFQAGGGHSEGLSLTKDGQAIPVEFRAKRFDYAGQPALLFHVHDISSRKQIEQHLLQSQKMEAIGRLAGGIAHDFNNLLTVIIGNVQFGLQDSKNKKPVQEDLRRIESAATQARDLVSQLLTFSRSQIFKTQPLDLNRLIGDHVKMFQRIIGETIAIKTGLSPKLALVLGDEAQIRQVLMNLSVNARDAMPNGGTLAIAAVNFSAQENSFKRDGYLKGNNDIIQKVREFVEITVSDTGVGIGPEIQSRVFDPFFTTKPLGKGTGLGLSVVHGIVEQHGGFIHLESQPTAGSKFKIYLPAYSDPQSFRKARKKINSIHGNGETILIVEDNENVAKVTERLLKTLGYHVLSANNGQQAEQIFEAKSNVIDLVVLDVVMPDASGPEIYKKFTKTKPGLPAIFVTGHDVYEELSHFQSVAGRPVSLLQKPYTKDGLGQKVKELLETS